ncbi:hypothetical protein D7Z54_28740 [Salibacterium salarium]|uniref:Uncharacterized protein n=1 Tax=Salibacterium salarium TaxID=284579 RepID=A0A428MUY2_9BACI|nr:hypothetical protein D7Z54_28740 [Salibacterium salarium]
MELANTQQVAEFYEVKTTVINEIMKRHRDENLLWKMHRKLGSRMIKVHKFQVKRLLSSS